jgi:hypothetical protein
MPIFALLIALCSLCGSTLHAEQITLAATVSNTNNGDTRALTHVDIHIPPQTFYQKLLAIKVEGADHYRTLAHNNSKEQYVALTVSLPPHSKSSLKVSYQLEITPQHIDLAKYLQDVSAPPDPAFVHDSENIEVSSAQIKAIAYLIKSGNGSLYDKLKLVYEFPSKYLTFIPLASKTSALSALKNARGDCTEYAYLFVALARSLNIPARVVTAFAIEKNTHFPMPNHNNAEIYVEPYGWVPVYPNLSRGKYDNAYALGNISGNLILFMRDANWTWSTHVEKQPHEKTSSVQSTINWTVKKF